MYVCEWLWNAEKAKEAQRIIEESTERLCPCKRGKPCPVAPRVFEVIPQSQDGREATSQ